MFWHFWKNVPEVWTIFVRRTFWGFWVLNGPLLPTPPNPIPGVNAKVPFRGKTYRNKYVFNVFLRCLQKLNECIKMITSCSIRRAGRSVQKVESWKVGIWKSWIVINIKFRIKWNWIFEIGNLGKWQIYKWVFELLTFGMMICWYFDIWKLTFRKAANMEHWNFESWNWMFLICLL